VVAVKDRPLLYFTTPAEWEEWLTSHLEHDGIRLQLRKKGTTKPGITYAEALDVALCWGWIDGQAGKIDDDFFYNGFSPRRARSPWSQINQGHVARLIDEGRMRPEGVAEIERAKADGRWDAAYRVKDAPTPPDLQAALDASPDAAAFFATLGSQQRFAFLFRLNNVKLEKTRIAKIATYIEKLERGETLN
jgi:uncharacterized protein YdeI (YjbR/CyaY-like superfamily)